jgi:hypothetical protein
MTEEHMASGTTGVTPIDKKHNVSLTDAQVNTILNALKQDYINWKDVRDFPLATELCAEIMDAYTAVRRAAR